MFSKLTNNHDIMEKVNPVFNTAKGTLLMLAGAGVDEAIRYLDELNFSTDEIVKKAGQGTSNNVVVALECMQEMRYSCINSVVMERGFKNIMDIACGYSPRGLKMSEEGINYIGCDLPIVVEELRRCDETFKEHSGRLEHIAIDATNTASVQKAASSLDGPIAIITEGLLTYFTESELRAFLKNIKEVLLQHGGCYISCDFGKRDYMKAAIKSIFDEEGTDKVIESLSNARNNISDIKSDYAVMRLGYDLLKEYGLKTEKVVFYRDDFEPSVKNIISKEQLEKLKDNFRKIYIDVITVEENKSVLDDNDSEFSFTSSCDGENGLNILVSGRLDTITSPELLEFFETEVKEANFKSVTFDFSNLSYISSAGLRVLLIYKKCIDNLKVINANDYISGIFEQTGFADIIEC